jgi:hypothetical protein
MAKKLRSSESCASTLATPAALRNLSSVLDFVESKLDPVMRRIIFEFADLQEIAALARVSKAMQVFVRTKIIPSALRLDMMITHPDGKTWQCHANDEFLSPFSSMASGLRTADGLPLRDPNSHGHGGTFDIVNMALGFGSLANAKLLRILNLHYSYLHGLDETVRFELLRSLPSSIRTIPPTLTQEIDVGAFKQLAALEQLTSVVLSIVSGACLNHEFIRCTQAWRERSKLQEFSFVRPSMWYAFDFTVITCLIVRSARMDETKWPLETLEMVLPTCRQR